MVICVCNKINEATIRREVQGGCRSVNALQDRLPIADQCSSCVQHTCQIISEETENQGIEPIHPHQPTLSLH